jgi:Domain of unknown function (DUF3850)
MTLHIVKSWTHFFKAIASGEKKHDLRYDADRNFKVGDILRLEEYDPFAAQYTGKTVSAKVTFITSRASPCAFSLAVLDRDYCILSLELVSQ